MELLMFWPYVIFCRKILFNLLKKTWKVLRVILQNKMIFYPNTNNFKNRVNKSNTKEGLFSKY